MIIDLSGINFAGGGGGGGEAVLTSATFSANTRYTPEHGVDGWSAVTVDVDVTPAYNSGYTEGYGSGYTSGYTSGETDGAAAQKALLTATAFTDNGLYTSENGFSGVTVNVQPRCVVICKVPTDAVYSHIKKIVYTKTAAIENVDAIYVNGVAISILDDIDSDGYYDFGDSNLTNTVTFYLKGNTSTAVLQNTDFIEVEWLMGVGFLDNYALKGVNNVQKVSLGDVSIIRNQAFANLSGYTGSDGITWISENGEGKDAFSGVGTFGSKVFQFSPSVFGDFNLSSVRTLGDNTFRNTKVTSVHFGSGLMSCSYNTFNNATCLTGVTFDDCPMQTMEMSFTNCQYITKFTFPKNVTGTTSSLNYPLFDNCQGLSSVVIGSAMTDMGAGMFKNSSGVTEITCFAPTAPALGGNDFDAITGNTGTLYVPNGADYSTWLAALGPNWTRKDSDDTDWSTEYLRFKITDSNPTGKVILYSPNTAATSTNFTAPVQYSINGGDWITIGNQVGVTYTIDNLSQGDIVRFKGSNPTYCNNNKNAEWHFSGTTVECEIQGNIMSLIYGDDFAGETVLPSAWTFYQMFADVTALTSAKNLVVPARELKESCYRAMFSRCSALTSTFDIDIDIPALNCFGYMYENCNLQKAPLINVGRLISGEAYSGVSSPYNAAFTATFKNNAAIPNIYIWCKNIQSDYAFAPGSSKWSTGCNNLTYVYSMSNNVVINSNTTLVNILA